MSADNRLPPDLLTESEATLRLVDSLLEELGTHEDDIERLAEAGLGQMLELLAKDASEPSNLTAVFLRVYVAVVGAIRMLRKTRGALERATVEQVQSTQQKLREVTSTTELAATDMLDGLDRALKLTDRLEEIAGDDEAPDTGDETAAAIRRDLREELFRLIGCLQFQDIAAQQLSHASSVLLEVEERLEGVVDLFDVSGVLGAAATGAETANDATAEQEARGYDPAATLQDAAHRQAMADEIFTGRSAGSSSSEPER